MGNGSPGTEQQFLGEQQAMQQIRPDLYKDRQAKYLPGVGISKVAIPQKDQDGLRGYDELLGAIDDAQAFHQQGTVAGAAGIGTAAYQTAQTKNNNITLAMNKLHGLNRINDHEYTNYKSNTPDTGSFFTAGTNAKFDELRRQVQAQKQNDTLHFGITPFQKGFSDKTAMAWAQQNPNDPRAKAIMQGQGIQ
jgi:soluble cytochrome b562